MKQTITPALLLALVFAFSACKQEASAPIAETKGLAADTVLANQGTPWALVFLPDGQLLFTEREGKLKKVNLATKEVVEISGVPAVVAKGQGGLLDIELHPDYASNGWIYLSYSSDALPTEKEPGYHTALMRAKLSGNALVDAQLLFKGKPNYTTAHHYGGRIEFDRQGFLFMSVGERGQKEQAQLLNNHCGKVIRLHDDGRVPADNPFVNQADALPEIYSYGHRNPQGMALNPVSGKLWAHEHGPQGGDEINIVAPAKNYGWPAITYGINYDGTIITTDTAKAGMEQPMLHWTPSIAPCGMAFINSDQYPGWKGDLLVGSLKFRKIVRCQVEGEAVVAQEDHCLDLGRIRELAQGPDGYIYVAVEAPGMIVRLVPTK